MSNLIFILTPSTFLNKMTPFKHVYEDLYLSLHALYTQTYKILYSHNIFLFSITSEPIVEPVITWGAIWVAKNIEFTKFYI